MYALAPKSQMCACGAGRCICHLIGKNVHVVLPPYYNFERGRYRARKKYNYDIGNNAPTHYHHYRFGYDATSVFTDQTKYSFN